MPKSFIVRDFRKKQFHFVDDVYLNGYAKLFDPHTTAVYLSLCRHAGEEQSCYPSQDLIAKEHNIGVRTVVEKIKLLQEWNIIQLKKERRPDGKWLRNTYWLIDREDWKPIPSAGDAHGKEQAQPCAGNCSSQVQELHTKKTTHKEEEKKPTKTKPLHKTRKYLESLPVEDIKKFKEKFGFSEKEITRSAERALNWLMSKGRPQKDYRAFFRNWLDKALEFKQEKNGDKSLFEGWKEY